MREKDGNETKLVILIDRKES